MSRRYQAPILVSLGEDGTPGAFIWRGNTYRVREVLGTWRLQDKWWDSQHYSNRDYYRLEVQRHMIFEIYRERAHQPEIWILDRVLD